MQTKNTSARRRGLSLLLSLALALALLPAGLIPTARAAAGGSFGAGNKLTWEFSGNGRLTISGTGEISAPCPWADIKSEVKTVDIQDGITKIGPNAFRSFSKMTRLSLPNTLREISENAFRACTSLTGVAIGEHVTTIDKGAFAECNALTGVYFYGDPPSCYGTASANPSFPNKPDLLHSSVFGGAWPVPGIELEDGNGVGMGYWMGATWTKIPLVFDAQDHGTSPGPLYVEAGGMNHPCPEPTPQPKEDGWTFGGWYREPECTTRWDFETDTVTGSLTLYAKWTKETATPSPSPTATPDPSAGVTVSGTLTSSGTAGSGVTTIQLFLNSQPDTPAYEITVTGTGTLTYEIPNVTPGDYTLKVSQEKRIAREYPLAVSGAETTVSQDVEIRLKGDISGDGEITAKDNTLLLRHIRETSLPTGYELQCADLSGGGVVSSRDKTLLLRHIRGTAPLW